METPVVSDEVIRFLDEVWTEELPMSDNPNDLFRAQGRKQVIQRLRQENKKQRM